MMTMTSITLGVGRRPPKHATLSNATSRTILSTKSNVAWTLLLVWTGP